MPPFQSRSQFHDLGKKERKPDSRLLQVFLHYSPKREYITTAGKGRRAGLRAWGAGLSDSEGAWFTFYEWLGGRLLV